MRSSLPGATPRKPTSGLAQSYQAPALQDDAKKSDVGGLGAKELALGAGAVGAGAAAGAAYGGSGPGNEGMGKWEHQQQLSAEGVQPNAGLTPEKQRTHDLKDPKIGETEAMAQKARVEGEQRAKEMMGDKTAAPEKMAGPAESQGVVEVDKEKSKAAQEAVGAAAVGTGTGLGAAKAMEGKGKGADEKPTTIPPSAQPSAGEAAVDKEKAKSAQAAAVGSGAGVGVMEAAEHKDEAKAEKKEAKKEAQEEKHEDKAKKGGTHGRPNAGPAYDTDYHPAALHPAKGDAAASGKDKEHLDREKAKEPAAEKDSEQPPRQGSEISEEGRSDGTYIDLFPRVGR